MQSALLKANCIRLNSVGLSFSKMNKQNNNILRELKWDNQTDKFPRIKFQRITHHIIQIIKYIFCNAKYFSEICDRNSNKN